MLDIYVINLAEREDRWNNIVEEFGKDYNLIRVDAVKHTNGHIGCFLSHKKCIQIAKEKGLKNIIVMEDDCIKNPKTNFNRFDAIVDFLNSHGGFDWDIFLGGASYVKPANLVCKICDENQLYQINRGQTTHMIMYNARAYDFFLNMDETKNIIDLCWHMKLKCVITLPYIAHQASGFSDTLGKESNYSKVFNNAENALMKHAKLL